MNLRRCFLTVLLVFTGWVGSASAIPITGSNIVTVNGTNWAQVDLFTSLSWSDINTVCDASGGGACSTGQLNGWDMESWTWASIDDINQLFNSYLSAAGVTGIDLLGPGADSYDENGSGWADNFFADGWRETAGIPLNQEIVAGWSASTNIVIGDGYSPNFAHSINGGFNDSAVTYIDNPKTIQSSSYGGWFYQAEQSSAVPTPATLALFGLGLAGMGWARRRKV